MVNSAVSFACMPYAFGMQMPVPGQVGPPIPFNFQNTIGIVGMNRINPAHMQGMLFPGHFNSYFGNPNEYSVAQMPISHSSSTQPPNMHSSAQSGAVSEKRTTVLDEKLLSSLDQMNDKSNSDSLVRAGDEKLDSSLDQKIDGSCIDSGDKVV